LGFPSTPEGSKEALSSSAPQYHSRVLVGSTTAICQRLFDEDGKLGLFFFAHDLGVRTEGVFTLKFALTDLASYVGDSWLKQATDETA
jgi:hypothetical protein